MDLAEWLSLGQLVAAVVGLGLAVWQLRKLVSRTEAVGRAVQKTRDTLAANQLMVEIRDLERIERDLVRAADDDDASAAEKALWEWRYAAIDYREQLHATGRGGVELREALQHSIDLFGIARGELKTPGSSVREATATVLNTITEVCVTARGVAGAMMLEAPDANAD